MTPTATAEPTAAPEQQREPTLLESLEALGERLVTSELPTPNNIRHWVGAIVYYLENGHTRPPERPALGEPLGDPRDAQIAALEDRLRALEQGPPVTDQPSQVAPERPQAPESPDDAPPAVVPTQEPAPDPAEPQPSASQAPPAPAGSET